MLTKHGAKAKTHRAAILVQDKRDRINVKCPGRVLSFFFCLSVCVCRFHFNQCLSGIAAGHPNCRCMCQQSRGPTPRQGPKLDTCQNCEICCCVSSGYVNTSHMIHDREPTAAPDFGSGSLVCTIK